MTAPAPIVVPLLTLAVALIGSNSFILGPLLPDVARDLGTGARQVGWVVSAFGAATAASAFLLAARIDRLGLRRSLRAGGLVFTLAAAGAALAPDWRLLALSQAAAGVATGLMLPATYAAATVMAAPGEAGRALGRVLRGWGFSLVVGVPLSAVIAQTAGWRLAYGLIALAGLAAWLGFARLPAPDRSRLPAPGLPPLRAAMLPGIPPLLLICLLFMTGFYGLYAFLGHHLRDALGASATGAGVAVLAYGLGFSAASFGDSLVDRLGAARVFAPVLLVGAALYLAFPLLVGGLAAAILWAGAWGFVNHFALNLLILELATRQPQTRGAVLACQTVTTYASVFAGPALLGWVVEGAGFAVAALVCAGLLGLAGMIAARLR